MAAAVNCSRSPTLTAPDLVDPAGIGQDRASHGNQVELLALHALKQGVQVPTAPSLMQLGSRALAKWAENAR